MDIISGINQKGGVGKTILILSIAGAAQAQGKKVVVIDLDPQGSASAWAARRAKIIAPDENDDVWPVVIDCQPHRLPAVVENAAQTGVDLVIIDTPGKAEHAARVAAEAAHIIFVPCRPSKFDTDTIKITQDIIRMSGDKPSFAVLNAIPAIGSRHEKAFEDIRHFDLPVCPHTVGNRVVFLDAANKGLTAMEVDPKGQGAQEILQVYSYTRSILGRLKPQRKGRTAHG